MTELKKLADRIALRKLADEEPTFDEWTKEQQSGDLPNPVSNSVERKLRSKLGPQASGLLNLYRQVRLMHDGAPGPEGGLVQAFRTETRIFARLLATKVDDRVSAPAINTLYDRMQNLKPIIQKIDQGYGTPTYRLLGPQLAQTLIDALRAADIPVTSRPGTDKTKWPTLRLMSAKDQQFERLKETRPDVAAQIEENRAKIKARTEETNQTILSANLIPSVTKIQGRVVQVGTDPVTNERLVYTPDGEVLSVEQFKQKIGRERRKNRQSVAIFPRGIKSPSRAGLRVLSDEQINDPDFIPDQEREPLPPGEEPVPGKPPPFLRVEYRALTDDLVSDPGTRVYPTKPDRDGRLVIVDGRFKGIYLDDLVNRAGRIIEGASYDFDKEGNLVRFSSKSPKGSSDVTANKEPYVTVNSRGALLIKIPYSQDYTRARNAVFALSAPRVPSIEAEPKTNRTTYTFEPKDFPSIRKAVGGCVLSAQAAKIIRDYFSQLNRQENAFKEEATKNFSLRKIGGFKERPVIDEATGLQKVDENGAPKFMDLLLKQREAMSWLESKGYSGVAALDTGIGKTLTSIALMQKMDRDGFADPGQKFLYVCPNKLKGNFKREAEGWLKNSDKFLKERAHRLTYSQFVRARKINPLFGTKEGDPTGFLKEGASAADARFVRVLQESAPGTDVAIPGYAAVFFDEAHELTKNAKSPKSVAAQKLNHPRKILLTASPMEDDPDALYIGAAIANNIDLNPPRKRGEITQAMKDKMSFFRRYVQTVGGRPIGLKPNDPKDPNKQEDFYAWAKANVYTANKRDVQEIEVKLPAICPDTVSVTMSPKVEKLYREAAREASKAMRAAVEVFKNRKRPVSIKDLNDLFGIKLRGALARIAILSDMPDTVVPGERSPKVDQSVNIIQDAIEAGKRTLLFTDNPRFAQYMAENLSSRVPSVMHAVALADKIIVYRDGGTVAKYTQRVYETEKIDEKTGKLVKSKVPKTSWASHVLSEIIGSDPKVVSAVLTKTYAHGQNLQMFANVVHLDRDSFSSETMKQRSARAWRTGQKSVVNEITLDAVYSERRNEADNTLDEVRRYIQELQESVFNQIVGDSQKAIIGSEWEEMKSIDASLVAVNRRLFELAMSPSPSNFAQMEDKP
jgi:hypothetical protein